MITAEVQPGRVMIDYILLRREEPGLILVVIECRTKYADIIGYSPGGDVVLDASEMSLKADREAEMATLVNIVGIPFEVGATFASSGRYSHSVLFLSKPLTDEGALLWEREDFLEIKDDVPEDDRQVTDVDGQKLVGVHDPSRCEGRPCSIHHPSDHLMKDWPRNWRSDRGIMERMCSHGVGHPDPDDQDYLVSIGRFDESIHGCCGCCVGGIG
jgi:hypothetical protein